MKQIEQERRSFEQQRRRIYRVAGVLGMLAILYTQYIIYIGTEESLLYEIIYTINHIVFASGCFAIVWISGTATSALERVERFMLFFSSSSRLFQQHRSSIVVGSISTIFFSTRLATTSGFC